MLNYFNFVTLIFTFHGESSFKNIIVERIYQKTEVGCLHSSKIMVDVAPAVLNEILPGTLTSSSIKTHIMTFRDRPTQ